MGLGFRFLERIEWVLVLVLSMVNSTRNGDLPSSDSNRTVEYHWSGPHDDDVIGCLIQVNKIIYDGASHRLRIE